MFLQQLDILYSKHKLFIIVTPKIQPNSLPMIQDVMDK